jgi:DNA-binding XRE family transcriptional regulator
MTQTELAEKLNLTRQSVSMYETGECFPDISIVIKIADIFDITIDELIRSGIPDT